jgi:lipoprotein-releasing system permease protein
MLSFRIAARFLRTSRTQSALIVAGIAVGIAVQIFVGSLITSLQANLVDTTIGSASQVTISAVKEGDPVVYTDRMRTVVTQDPRVKPGAVAPVVTVSALYTNGAGDSAPLNLKGGDLSGLNAIYGLASKTVEGKASLGSGEIMIGTDLARKYGIRTGDPIGLVLQNNQRTQLRVSGIFDLGSSAVNERQAFVNPDLPRNVLGWSSNKYSAIETQMRKPFQAATVAASWSSKLPGVSITDWQAQNADLLTALQSQSSSSYMIQAFVLIAVALGIASTLAISAVQKTRQIGILKAMGMTDRKAGRIFLWQAAILGVFGTASGIGVGYLLVLGFSFAPVSFSIRVQPLFAAISASIGIIVALLSSIIPTRNTSRLDPIEVIQSG